MCVEKVVQQVTDLRIERDDDDVKNKDEGPALRLLRVDRLLALLLEETWFNIISPIVLPAFFFPYSSALSLTLSYFLIFVRYEMSLVLSCLSLYPDDNNLPFNS